VTLMSYRLTRYPVECPGRAMTFSVRKRKAGIVILSLVLGFATVVLAARRQSDPKSDVRTIKTLGKRVLVGPEGTPFNMPSDAAVGQNGVLYVLDGVNHRVVAYDANGEFRFQFGNRGSKRGQLLFPLGIATAPDGRIYVADSGNHRFQIFATDGKPIDAVTLPPVASGAPPDPTDVAVDPLRERLYIIDNDNHHIILYNLATRSFGSVWGSPGQAERQFRFPFLLDVSSQGYVFVVEPINTRVQVLNPEGKFVGFIGGWGVEPGQLFRPKGITIDADRVFVTDSYLGHVQVFKPTGEFLGLLADAAGTPMKFITPTGITCDPERKRLYVVELKANRVCRVDLE
jgi:DNA-binding beta-propeller fold protein YncE